MLVPSTPVVHLELHTGDLRARAGLLLAAVRLASRPRRHAATARTTRSSSAAGSAAASSSARPTRPLWLPYVEVPEIGAATQRARDLGAAVLLEAREGPAGWRSVVATPAAGEIAFWQAKR